MFTNHYEFSLLSSGDKMRVLVAPIDALTGRPGTAQALLTASPAAAEDLVRCLRGFSTSRHTMLADWVQTHPGIRCELRRTAGDLLAAGTDPDTVAQGPLTQLAPVIDAGNQIAGAGRTAVRQLLLSMLEGCDDIPVRVQLQPEHLEDDATVYANHWLTCDADDDDIAGLLDEDLDVIHDSVQWTLREQYPWLEEWMEHSWVAMTVNVDDLRAWVADHRPHLAG